MSVRVIHPAQPTNTLANFATTSTSVSANVTGQSSFPENGSQPKAGDLVLVFIQYNSTSSTDPTATLSGAAMTQVGTTQAFGSNRYGAVFRGVVTNTGTSSPGVNVTVPATVSVSLITARVFAGVDATTPIDVTPVQGSLSAGTSHAYGPITPTTDGAMVVAFVALENDNGGGSSSLDSAITDWTNQDNYGTSGGTDGSIGVWTREVPTATATSITATSGASIASCGFLIALRPASGGDPLDDILIARSATCQAPASSGGFTLTPGNPNIASRRRTLSEVTDIIVIVFLHNDGGASIKALSSPSGWEVIRESLALGVSLQVYARRWTNGMSLPSITLTETTDRAFAFAMVLRGIDPNDIFDVDQWDIGGGAAQAVFPTVTTTKANAVIMRMAFNWNDAEYPTGAGEDGSSIWVHPLTDGWSTTTGLDQNLMITARKLNGAAGSIGTETVPYSAVLAGVTAYTLALNAAPPINALSATLTADASIAEVGDGFESVAGAIFLEPDPITVEAEITADFRSFRKNNRPAPRQLIWVRNYAGEQVNVID